MYDSEYLVNFVGFNIYSCIYMVCNDVYCVIYIYLLNGIVVLVNKDGLLLIL